MSVPVVETERLRLCRLSPDSDADADFILRQLNDPGFIRFIADRGVRKLDDARAYIRNGPAASYAQHGHGLYRVSLQDGTPIGLCGLLRREGLDAPDLGYSLLGEFTGYGYAIEAAAAVLADGRERLGFSRILAIVDPDNAASIRLLQKLGFGFATMARLPGIGHDVQLFVLETE